MTTRKAARAASYLKALRGRPCYRRATPRTGTRSPGNKEGVMIRSLSALVLYELSLVTRPAYEASMAERRAKNRFTLTLKTARRFLLP